MSSRKSKSRSSKSKKSQVAAAPSRKPVRRHNIAASDLSSSHQKKTEVSENMSLVELQKIARNRGIPFGGLRKSQLVRKILTY